MIHVEPPPAPTRFKEDKIEERGLKWLEDNPGGDPHKYPLWREYVDDLRKGFHGRCGILALRIPFGTVDHWVSTKSAPARAYDWTNYRFLEGRLNNAKKPSWDGKLLDPFDVRDHWFEIELPSLELVISDDIDPAFRERAEYTLQKFHIGDGHDSEDYIRLRREWLDLYERGRLDLMGLAECAPMLARAVAKRDGLEWPHNPPG